MLISFLKSQGPQVLENKGVPASQLLALPRENSKGAQSMLPCSAPALQ